MARLSWHERLFRALMRLFPSEFRGDFGDQMAADLRDAHEEAATRGGRPLVVRMWARTLVDVGRRAPREHLDVLRRDAGYAVRLMRRRPGLTASALLTLSIGIGLNAAVFTVVDGILWRSLPIPESDRLVRLFEVEPAPAFTATDVSSPNFIDWESQARTLDGMAMVGGTTRTLIANNDPEEILAMTVSRGFFRIVPARPALGRLFTPADYAPLEAHYAALNPRRPGRPAAPGAVILSHDLWQRQFNGRDVVGRTVRLDGNTIEIVGVMGPDFAFRDVPGWGRAECWLPEAPDPTQRRWRGRSVIGRRAPGVSLPRVQAEFDVIAAGLAAAYPGANAGRGVRVAPLLDTVVAEAKTQIWFLFGAALCVLLVGCANVAHLLLAHATGRRLELATRVALGATRAHLVRQALTEGVLLALAGGAAGLFLAVWAVPVVSALAPPGIPRLEEVALDGRVVAFTAGLSLIVGVACGLAATLSFDRMSLTGMVRASSAATSGHGRRFRQGLTIAEIALALMLVIAAGLLIRTVRALGALELGFDPANVISIGLSPDWTKYGGAEGIIRLESQFVERLAALPGVIAVGVGSRPLGGGGMSNVVRLPGGNGQGLRVGVDTVSPGYLEALGARLLRGRFVEEKDTGSALGVMLVNESAARTLWGERDPIGQVVTMDDVRLQVVGVVGDIRRNELESKPGPAVYLPHRQSLRMFVGNVLVRTEGDPRQILPAVRTVMRQIDPEQALTRITTLQARIDEAMAPRRFILQLVGLFSALALGLAILGVYAVVAESVAQRIPEIGIRIALGATPSNVMRLVVSQGGWMAAAGIALGLGGALALSRAMTTLVFGVATTDPLAYVTASLSLLAATLVACGIPARRASRIDPVIALRQE